MTKSIRLLALVGLTLTLQHPAYSQSPAAIAAQAAAQSAVSAANLANKSDELVVIQVKLDNVMQPKSGTDVFVDCTKNKVCKGVIDAAAAYVGVDSSAFTSAVALFANSRKDEESNFRFTLPPGYQYCRAKVDTVSVVPATGDRASFMSITGDTNGVAAYTWTPLQNLGGGRSWIEADFTVVGVRDSLVNNYRSKGICKATYLRAECRGAKGVNKGSKACGAITD